MAHRTISQVPEGVPEINPMLEAVLLQALDIAREKLDAKEPLVPFTALAVGETLFTETHPSEDPDECFRMAQHTVQNARGALAYAFCYDGYVETNEGELDAIIAEGGMPGDASGHAAGYLYAVEGEGDSLEFRVEDQAIYIGEAPNFMEFTLIVEEDTEESFEEAGEDAATEDVADEDEADGETSTSESAEDDNEATNDEEAGEPEESNSIS